MSTTHGPARSTPAVEPEILSESATPSPVSSRSSPLTTDNTPFDDGEDSACFSTSSTGHTSATVRDVYSNGSNDNSSGSQQDASSDQAQRTKAVFDKVVLDAMQRQHIRTKHACRDYDTESDSSSGSVDHEHQPKSDTSARVDSLEHFSPISTSSKRLRVSDSGVSSEQHDNTDHRHTPLLNHSKSSEHCRNKSLEHCRKQPFAHTVTIASRGHRTFKRVHRAQEERHRPIPEESSSSGSSDHEEHQRKQRRFFRTFSALRECGLMDISLQTAALMERNRKIQDEISSLRHETETTYRQMLELCQQDQNFADQRDTQKTMQSLCLILNKNDKIDGLSQNGPPAVIQPLEGRAGDLVGIT